MGQIVVEASCVTSAQANRGQSLAGSDAFFLAVGELLLDLGYLSTYRLEKGLTMQELDRDIQRGTTPLSRKDRPLEGGR